MDLLGTILGTSRIQKFLDTYTDMRKDISPGSYHIEHINAIDNKFQWTPKDDCWRYAVVIDYHGKPTINWNQILQLKHDSIFYSEDNFLSMIPVTKTIISTDYMWKKQAIREIVRGSSDVVGDGLTSVFQNGTMLT